LVDRYGSQEKKKKVYAFLNEESVKMQYTTGLPREMLSRVNPLETNFGEVVKLMGDFLK